MSTLRKQDRVVALLVSDLHLSHTPPLARDGEPDWYEAMARPLRELTTLQLQYGVPILCAGDVFDKWNPCPELINFAIKELPVMYAIPGQHDLPLHSLGDIKRSGYYTLSLTGKIKDMSYPVRTSMCNEFLLGDLVIRGYPWGVPIEPITGVPFKLNVSLVHEYTYIQDRGYAGAPEEAKCRLDRYKGHDVVVIGDNHISWEVAVHHAIPAGDLFRKIHQTIWNCGGFMRRKSDESARKPRIGMLYGDGHVRPYYLPTNGELMTVVDDAETVPHLVESLDRFLHDLKTLQAAHLDYREALKRAMAGQTDEIKQVLNEVLA